jgi:predicted nucleotidyltransferase
MKRKIVIEILNQNQTELEDMGEKSLMLFGSVARDEATPESDVDILVEFTRPMGLLG